MSTVTSRRRRTCAGAAASRSASIGVTRVARSAGRNAEPSVTSVPTSIETTTVRGFTTLPLEGSVMPNNSSRLRSTAAIPSPARTPSAEAISAITSASTSTAARTWRREAPSVRRIPNSRVRWATVIEKVLKIVKAPTNRAIPANTSSAVLMKLRNSPRPSSFCSTAFSSPVRTVTLAPGGSAARTRRFSSCGLIPGAA